MAEILVMAINKTHSDPTKDRRGCYKQGMPVTVFADGHSWGREETLPTFVKIKIPGVSIETVKKYIEPQVEDAPNADGIYLPYRRRLWQIQWSDLPAAARKKLKNNGELVIKVGSYSGTYDYTWAQIKTYFKNLKTRLAETGDL